MMSTRIHKNDQEGNGFWADATIEISGGPLQNENGRGPRAFESFQVHGQSPNKIIRNSIKIHEALRSTALYIFEVSRLRSFRESAWLEFRRTPMPLCKPLVDETGRNGMKPSTCIIYLHMISQLVQSFVFVTCK